MRLIYLVFPLIIVSLVFSGCMGTGKTDLAAAKQVMEEVKTKYGDKIKDIKIYRDKMQIAFPKGAHPVEKSQIFQDAAATWWRAYPANKKPIFKLYCWAYDDVISDDDIGSLTLSRGKGNEPNVMGQPGIYILRDVK